MVHGPGPGDHSLLYRGRETGSDRDIKKRQEDAEAKAETHTEFQRQTARDREG